MLSTFPYTALRQFCKRIYGDIPLLLTPTVYLLNFGDFAAAGGITKSVPINAQADFVMTGIQGDGNVDSASTILLTDTSNAMPFMSSPSNWYAVAGQGNSSLCGWFLPYPYFMGANTSMLAQFVAGGASNDVTLSLIGFNIREMK